MIDIHCHLLPEIDDGAKNLDMALAMARAAVDDGIGFSVMTPHINPGRYDNTRTRIELRTRNFRNALKAAKIPLEIGMAAEVRLAPEILDLLDKDEIPFYGEMDGFRVMLLEFPHTHIPPGADRLVERLIHNRIRPIIAHPERNKDVIRDLDKIRPFVEMGCLLQLTAGAVAGQFGKGPRERAEALLKTNVFKVLATDAHNMRARTPELSAGRDAAAEIVGFEAADDMVYANPLMLVRGQMQRDRDAEDEFPADEETGPPQPEGETAPSENRQGRDQAVPAGEKRRSAKVHVWPQKKPRRTSGQKKRKPQPFMDDGGLPDTIDKAMLAIYFKGRPVLFKAIAMDGRKYMIGRKKDNDVILRGDFISRHHALLVTLDGQLEVSDLNSTNGIVVNGRRAMKARLSAGDRIAIGDYQIFVSLRPAAGTEKAASPQEEEPATFH